MSGPNTDWASIWALGVNCIWKMGLGLNWAGSKSIGLFWLFLLLFQFCPHVFDFSSLLTASSLPYFSLFLLSFSSLSVASLFVNCSSPFIWLFFFLFFALLVQLHSSHYSISLSSFLSPRPSFFSFLYFLFLFPSSSSVFLSIPCCLALPWFLYFFPSSFFFSFDFSPRPLPLYFIFVSEQPVLSAWVRCDGWDNGSDEVVQIRVGLGLIWVLGLVGILWIGFEFVNCRRLG